MAARAGAPRAQALLRVASSLAWCEHVRPLCTASCWPGMPSPVAQAVGLRSGSRRRRAGRRAGGRGLAGPAPRGARRAAPAPRVFWASRIGACFDQLLPTERSGLGVDNGRRIPPLCGSPVPGARWECARPRRLHPGLGRPCLALLAVLRSPGPLCTRGKSSAGRQCEADETGPGSLRWRGGMVAGCACRLSSGAVHLPPSRPEAPLAVWCPSRGRCVTPASACPLRRPSFMKARTRTQRCAACC